MEQAEEGFLCAENAGVRAGVGLLDRVVELPDLESNVRREQRQREIGKVGGGRASSLTARSSTPREPRCLGARHGIRT